MHVHVAKISSAAQDLASILEERLSEAEHRLLEVLQNVWAP